MSSHANSFRTVNLPVSDTRWCAFPPGGSGWLADPLLASKGAHPNETRGVQFGRRRRWHPCLESRLDGGDIACVPSGRAALHHRLRRPDLSEGRDQEIGQVNARPGHVSGSGDGLGCAPAAFWARRSAYHAKRPHRRAWPCCHSFFASRCTAPRNFVAVHGPAAALGIRAGIPAP